MVNLAIRLQQSSGSLIRASVRPAHLVLLLVLLLAGCAGPAGRMDAEARHLGLQRLEIPGDGFAHTTYENGRSAGALLHVYLGSDGTPWINHRWVAADPTPRDPLLLRLLALDTAPAVYLGRPCYHGARGPECKPWIWTMGRYAPAVVRSLAVALGHIYAAGRYDGVVLVGYSGGGTLAMLLAPMLTEIRGIVTLAGNLDSEAWSRLHAYAPLTASLNPARQPPLPARILQLHLAGARDRNVPPALSKPVVARQAHAELRVIEGYDHRCCWEALWPSVLAELQRRLSAPITRGPRGAAFPDGPASP